MKGLLIKDLKLMNGQRSFFIVIVVVALVMAVASPETFFTIGFLGFIGSLFALSSISYDEFDNGNAFLFTLPITRKGYVLEKYAFGIIVGLVSLLFGTGISILAVIVRGTGNLDEILVAACTMLPIILLILGIMLPFQLKFGGEKGRIAIIAVLGCVFVIVLLFTKVSEALNIDIATLIKSLPHLSGQTYFLLFLLLSIIVQVISYRISFSIMKKKEF